MEITDITGFLVKIRSSVFHLLAVFKAFKRGSGGLLNTTTLHLGIGNASIPTVFQKQRFLCFIRSEAYLL